MPHPFRFCLRVTACALLTFGAAATQAQDRFTASADGQEMRDTASNLTWRRCVEGQKWDGTACTGKALKYSYAGAKKAAAGAGTGWRIPTREDLVGLVDKSGKKPRIDAKVFPGTPRQPLWASRAGSDDNLGAWLVHANGKVTGNVGQAKFPLRLVRAG